MIVHLTKPKAKTTRNYDRNSRWYEFPDGMVYGSVTNVLGACAKPALTYWSANRERVLVTETAADLFEEAPATPKMSRMAFLTTLGNRLGKKRAHQKELEKASDIGSQAHSLIEWNLRREMGEKVGKEPVVRPESLHAFTAWEDWRRSVNLTPMAVEEVAWNDSAQYAGTVDLIAKCVLPDLGEVIAVLDWKTGKAIYGEALLQNSAYIHALIEMGNDTPPITGIVVRLPKVETDPDFEVRVIPWEEVSRLYNVFLAVKYTWNWMQEEEKKKNEEAKPAKEKVG